MRIFLALLLTCASASAQFNFSDPTFGGFVSSSAPDTNYATGVNLSSGLSYWRSALANSNSARIEIMCIGDSKTEGYYASPNDGFGRITNSWAGRLRNQLQSAVGGSGEGFMGAYRVGTTYAPHNFVYGGSWSTGTVGGYSGGPFNGGRWATGNANTITLTNVYCTSFDIYYTENSFTGNAFKVDVNGNNVLTNSQSGPATESAKRVTITTNLTDGTIVIRAPDASKYFMFNGIALYGATNGVFVHNLGMNGKKIGDYAPSASWATSMPVALTIIDMDANDYSAHTDTNTYGGSFSNFLSYHTNASILVMNGMTNRVAGPPIQSAYWAVERRLTTFNPAILSIDDYWGGYRSEFYYDATHPNQDGHSNIANYVYSKLIQ